MHVNRRSLIASGSTALLGATLFRTARAAPDTGSLSARPTAGGPVVTPVRDCFAYSEMRLPAATPASIDVDGLVNTPTRFSVAELGTMPHVEHLWTFECFVNTAGGPLIYTTPFKGVPLAALLQKAGLKPEVRSARIETSDGHGAFLLPMSELRRPDVMLVATMGSAPLSMEHGSAYTRLLIPGAGGNHQPKWVSRISFTDAAADENASPPLAGFLSPAPPTTTGSLAGVTLTGYAFAAPEPVGSIELSTDNGTTFQAMPLPPQPDPNVWITWEVKWRPPERGFYVLRVRATSATGRKQDTPGVIAVEVR
jgi:DMSO/TMAO reductase YedYZ molybdopterin-dependent catalytic subunit